MTGLLIVDAQNGLFERIEDAAAKLNAMHVLLEAARSAGAPVFFTEDVDVGAVGSAARAIHAVLKPLEGETVIEKGAADAFHGTNLEERLRQAGVNNIVLSGLQTPICVFATTMGAVYRGFNVILAADAHGTQATEELSAERVVAYHNEFLDGFGSTGHGFDASHPNVRVQPVAEIDF